MNEPSRPPQSVMFTLPIRVRNILNNSQGITRGGMFARAKERKEHRSLAERMTRAHARGMWAPWTITITRVAPSSGLDSDSLPASCKGVRDGVTDGLGYSNDRDPAFEWRYDQRRGPKGYYAVEVRIESVTTEKWGA